MKKNHVLSVLVAAMATSCIAPASADDVLTGDPRLACEAILCLASGTKPAECTASLSRYFSISFTDWRDTIKGRIDFLNLCPASNQTTEMSTLVSAMGSGAGQCDAHALNMTLRQWRWGGGGDEWSIYVSDQMPYHCSAYTGHQYTYELAPKYIGTPERDGFWADPREYDAALADYNARMAAIDEQQQDNARRRNYWWSN